MPKITAIVVQEKDKNRCNLFVDGEFLVGLSIECVLKNRIKVGQDVSNAEIFALAKEDERGTALTKAINYVSARLKTKKQVKDYLLKKGYSEDTVWYCIDKLKDYNLINDLEYAKRYVESTGVKQGKRMMAYKLMAKGLNKEDINVAIDSVEVDTFEGAYNLALKHIRNKEITKENLSKTYRYLLGKGFSYEEAEKAIDKIKGND